MVFDFFAKPLRIEGEGRAERIIVERTELDENGAARGTGETYEVPASLDHPAIGYSTPPIDGIPYDERGGKFANEGGMVGDRLYAVGWARRGPTGTIGTNRPDGYEVAEQVAAAMPAGSSRRQGRCPGADPATLFSGVFFPVEQLPGAVRPVAYALPLWHAVELNRAAMLGGTPPWPVAAHVGFLLVWAIGGGAWVLHAFRRRLTD